MGIFTKIKVAFAALVAGGIALLGFMLSREKSKNAELTEDNRVLEGNLAVKDESHKDELAIKDFETDRERNEKEESNQASEEKESTDSKIDNTSDGEEYKVDI